MTLPRTPSQTVGPFFWPALDLPDGQFVVPAGTAGSVWLRGRVIDGAGAPVPDALVETWQADSDGSFADGSFADGPAGGRAGFRGFGRCPTDRDGAYAILTCKPGAVPGLDGRPHAPHVDVSVFARGLLKRAVTRIYFPEDADAHASDPVLTLVDDPVGRASLVAARSPDGYRFDIRLQGEGETVFFEV